MKHALVACAVSITGCASLLGIPSDERAVIDAATGDARTDAAVGDDAPLPLPDGPGSPCANGLIAYWSFDGTLDGVGPGTPLSSGTQAAMFVAGRIGSALALDGTGTTRIHSLAFNGSLDLGASDFTVAFWVKYTRISTFSLLEKFTGAEGPGWSFAFLASNQYHLAGSPGNRLTTAAVATAVGTWIHLAVVREGGQASIYVDGNQLLPPTPAGAYAPSTEAFRIGGPRPGTNGLDGALDDVSIWKRALTAGERAALRAGTSTPTCT